MDADKTAKIQGTSDSLVIGGYYEIPDGHIVLTHGWNGTDKTVSYYFDDDKEMYSALPSQWETWKLRRDLQDFPNARDPRVPYVFDLNWDIKTRSQLLNALKTGEDAFLIRHVMAENGICLTQEEENSIKEANS
jgi:hypothetical protein